MTYVPDSLAVVLGLYALRFCWPVLRWVYRVLVDDVTSDIALSDALALAHWRRQRMYARAALESQRRDCRDEVRAVIASGGRRR